MPRIAARGRRRRSLSWRFAPAALLIALFAAGGPNASLAGGADPDLESAVKAFESGDSAALNRLAADRSGDLWLWVDELVSTGHPKAASACIAHAPEALRKPLLDCAAALAVHPTPPDVRARVRKAREAYRVEDWAGLRSTLEGAPPTEDSPSRAEWAFLAGRGLQGLGDAKGAGERLIEAVARADRLGWPELAQRALLQAAVVAFNADDYDLAIRRNSDLRARQIEAGQDEAAALTEIDIATALVIEGRLPDCVRRFRLAIPRVKSPAKCREVAVARSNLGFAYMLLGMYADALEELEAAEAAFKKCLKPSDSASRQALLGADIANVVSRTGIVRKMLRQFTEAAELHRRALETLRALGDDEGVAQELGNLATCLRELHSLPAAEEAIKAAQEFFEKHKREGETCQCLADRALCRAQAGDKAGSLALRTAALARVGGISSLAIAIEVLEICGRAALASGEVKEALEIYRRALTLVESSADVRSLRPLIREGLARCYLALELPGQALEAARAGLADARDIATPLGATQQADVLEGYADLFDAGFTAAARLGRAGDALSFVESARSQALLAALGGAYAIREALVPVADRSTLVAAEGVEARAHATYDLAVTRGERRVMDPLRVALDAASRKVELARADVERDKKRISDFSPTSFEGVERFRRRLAPGQVFVEYVLGEPDAYALVVAPEEKQDRLVALGPSQAITDACGKCTTGGESKVALDEVVRLREIVWTPIGLGDAVRQVLVSPDGELAVIPPVLLDPKRVVSYVPSASVLAALDDRRDRHGKDVLALGNCSYGKATEAARARAATYGLALRELPGTAAEVSAISAKPLLGDDASEPRFRQELLAHRGRWDAIVLACHGVLNPDNPLLSALALSAGGDDDGFLTMREILGMRFETDLLVLSACETALGKAHRGEGVMSCARAFLFAGAPRVVASLWSVDDAATSFLMQDFFRHWNDHKTGAAEALRLAQKATQEHVDAATGKTLWADPKYWAAWVLWGLPE